MQDFALVTEGVTDQAIIENLLIGYFQEAGREPDVNRAQPEPHDPHGGWSLVFRFLEQRKYRAALSTNRYVIIHVDTDVYREYEVKWTEGTDPEASEELVRCVVARLVEKIDPEDWAAYSGRFSFAIAVHSTECWVLTQWSQKPSDDRKIANCLETLGKIPNLRDELSAKGFKWMTSNDKEPRTYQYASKGFKKRKAVMEAGGRNVSLGLFLRELDGRQIVLT